MKLTIDFESRSACDLKKHGAWVYSEHPTTEVLCMAYKMEDWRQASVISCMEVKPNWAVFDYVDMATTIEAHNAQFELAIWENVCVKKYGWPHLPLKKLRCSAAKAAMHSLPRSLEGACQALGLPVQKDMEGYRLMLRMSKPRKPKKGEPDVNPKDLQGYYWNENPADLERLYQYCMTDVEAEEALSNVLRDLPETEQQIWLLDATINARGIQADLTSCKRMLDAVAEHEEKLLAELRSLTNGAVKTAKQIDQMLGYLRGLGVDLPDLQAATVAAALKGDINARAKKILEIRSSLGRSSSAKYKAIIDRASADGRVRGTLLYHGADTGRWSGAGIQPQNFPSRIKTSANPESLLEAVNAGGLGLYNALYDDDPMDAAGAITRSVLVAADGKDLVVADYSAVEGRGLAWLAGEETELAIYRSDADVYVATASMILHKPYDLITPEERNRIGKTATLACGYQGGVGAVRKFGGEGLTDDEIKETIVTPWRDNHPATVRFWSDLEAACLSAVRERGKAFLCRGVGFKVQDSFLLCRLPSGRMLFYYHPRIEAVRTPWGEDKGQVTYMTVDGMTKKWIRTNTYGGKLAENITQAICRDLMAGAMLRVEPAGYHIVLTVHDELVCEVPEEFGSVEELVQIMCVVPSWAKGFPIKAAGWRGKRYKK